MALMAGMAVSAAGTLAGGMAAGALGAGGGGGGAPLSETQGVNYVNIGGQWIPQVDPSKAISYFQQAAQQQNQYLRKGLSYYTQAINQAKGEINQYYAKANKTLAPVSFAGIQALNEQMRFMGLDPMPQTQIMGVREQLSKIGNYPSIQNAIDRADNIQDPKKRAAAKNNIMNMINKVQASDPADIVKEKLNGIEQQLNLNKGQLGKQLTSLQNSYQSRTDNLNSQLASVNDKVMKLGGVGALHSTDSNVQQQAIDLLRQGNQIKEQLASIKTNFENNRSSIDTQLGNLQDRFNTKQDALNSQLAGANKKDAMIDSKLSGFKGLYNAAYTKEGDFGYTGDQLTQKLQATPGYQFQLDQGIEAIRRKQSAQGSLGSSDTLYNVQKYGQDQALSFYNTAMTNLQSIAQQGLPATMQISQNQVNQGNALSQLDQSRGTMGANIYGQIGQALANSKNMIGSTVWDATKTNASLQNSAIQQAQNMQMQQQKQLASQLSGGSSGGGSVSTGGMV